MFSEKFLRFIKIWQDDFAIERSIDQKTSVDKNGEPLPWYTYPAIEYLSQFDYSTKSVFEYGCGYSSLFWAKRAKQVTSVEDNTLWFEKWNKEFNCSNLCLKLREEQQSYCKAIADDNCLYDVIIIDGKFRKQCALEAVNHLKSGGMIILDDSDRVNTSSEYIEVVQILKEADLLQIDFYGFCPMNNYTKATSVFFCRNFNFVSLHHVQPVNGIGNLWGMSRRKRKEFYKENM